MATQRYYDDEDQILNVTASITAEDTWTDLVEFNYTRAANLSVGGSGWVATVTLQRTFDGGSTWLDVWTTTEPAEKGIATNIQPGLLWRLGVKTGDYTSGTIPVRLGQ